MVPIVFRCTRQDTYHAGEAKSPYPLPIKVPICNQTVFMPHITTLLQSDGSEATGTGTYWKQATVRRHQRLNKIA